MRAFRPSLLLALLCGSSAWAQTTPPMVGLCIDATQDDQQPNFALLDPKNLSSISLTPDNALRLNTNLEVLNPERIYFPFAQQVRISYLYEDAGNSTALGYFYYQDLVDRGYIDNHNTPNDSSDDSLADKDNDGIADFHEALFQMDGTLLSNTARRCNNTFPYTYKGVTRTMFIPELASKTCGDYFQANQDVKYAGPVATGTRGNISGVGVLGQDDVGDKGSTTQFSDRGLYGNVPNLLEPRDPKNNNGGIGHIIFLHSDDDGDLNTGANLGATDDTSTWSNGIPDYNVSLYDADGRRISPEPANDARDEEKDRTVNLGEIQGDREIVFFTVSWGNTPAHAPNGSGYSTVNACLSFKPLTDQCMLNLKGPVNVYFSKTFMNLDQNSQVPLNLGSVTQPALSVAERDIGCPYKGETKCAELNLAGWLDQSTLNRLTDKDNYPVYNDLDMPHERASVKADTSSGHNMMPHVLVGAPSTDKFRWVLGFEDLPGGGDRDFNDVSFMIHKSNGGRVRSAVVSDAITPNISQDYTITEVTFGAEDESYYAASAKDALECSTQDPKDRPRIRYQVALDCKVCTANCASSNPTLSANPRPTWVDVPLSDPPANGKRKETVTMRDFLERSLTGSQLCWQAILESKNDKCQPTIRNVDVFYKAVKAGDYGRSSVAATANAVLYGTYETPGRTWFDSGVTPPSVRVVDGRPDMVERGHLYLKELFRPETPSVTTGTKLWDSGDKLASSVRVTSVEPSSWRKLISTSPTGQRSELKQLLTDIDGGEAFSSDNCGQANGGDWVCDLDRSGGPPDDKDRALLRNWLYGWERRTGSGTYDTRRTWPMGGVQLSTPTLIASASMPEWTRYATGAEKGAFISTFSADPRVSQRPAVAYVGTTQGFFHGVAAGSLKWGDDPCTTATVEANGYFKVKAASGQNCPAAAAREYGDAGELFSYMPRKLLPYYVSSYLRKGNGKRASVDASPSVSDVDLGFGAYDPIKGLPKQPPTAPWTIGPANNIKPTEGAKTVVVSATGPALSVVFSLDITDPASTTSYPLPMWEFDMSKDKFDLGGTLGSKTVEDAFGDLMPKDGKQRMPDTRGSRHRIPVVRMDMGTAQRWVAVVGTDYVPNPNAAGTIYLVDMKTGAPVQVGSAPAAKLAGVIPLDKDEGIAGSPSVLDANRDSFSELIYAATTKGKVYRIATNRVDPNGLFGRTFQVCQIADVQKILLNDSDAGFKRDAPYEGIYSDMAVQLTGGADSPKVRVFFGTGNNPDISDEPADKLKPAPHGYLVALQDENPLSASCPPTPDTNPLASKMWVKQLGEGQTVWGGVAIAQDISDPANTAKQTINTSTAVGSAANACALSATQSGMMYSVNVATPQANLPATGTPLNGHSMSAPIVYDGHILSITATGRVQSVGAGPWGNPSVQKGEERVRIQMWDADPSGAVKP